MTMFEYILWSLTIAGMILSGIALAVGLVMVYSKSKRPRPAAPSGSRMAWYRAYRHFQGRKK